MLLVCNLEAMTPAQRKHYAAAKKRLHAAVQEVKELPNGYAFRYAAEPDLLIAATEFITGERQCCPFFHFTLEVAQNGGPMWLRITGPKGAKSFLKSALASR